MRCDKEEKAGLTLAALAVVTIYFAHSRIAIEGQEFSTMGRSPVLGVIFGSVCVVGAILGLWSGSFGDPDRNGRKERPLAFWSAIFALSVFGIGLAALAIIVLRR